MLSIRMGQIPHLDQAHIEKMSMRNEIVNGKDTIAHGVEEIHAGQR